MQANQRPLNLRSERGWGFRGQPKPSSQRTLHSSIHGQGTGRRIQHQLDGLGAWPLPTPWGSRRRYPGLPPPLLGSCCLRLLETMTPPTVAAVARICPYPLYPLS
jgi:hypothetical protein